MRRESAGLNDGDVDNGAEFFRSERDVVISQPPVFSHASVLEGLDAFGEPDFRHRQGRGDFFNFVRGLEFAFGKKARP